MNLNTHKMALVRIFSDLHLEFGLSPIKKCIDICSKNKTKYIILAGDITNFKQREHVLSNLVSALKPFTEQIIYILGNHEYYELGETKPCDVTSIYKDLSKSLDITFLENESIDTNDFTFYGTTLWTKLNDEAFQRMNDQFSFTSKQDILNIHEESKTKLETFINNYNSKKPLVVITHHMPSFKLIDKQYQKYALINSGFANELDNLIKYPISYWIYGHTHIPNNCEMNGVKMLCNPHGYFREANLRPYSDCIF